MLILSRRPGESIVIDSKTVVRVLYSDENVVRLGITAPPDVQVHRAEIFLRIHHPHLAAAAEEGPVTSTPRVDRPAAAAALAVTSETGRGQ
jgi:carbon storage regulator